jgi:hypothetical protein
MLFHLKRLVSPFSTFLATGEILEGQIFFFLNSKKIKSIHCYCFFFKKIIYKTQFSIDIVLKNKIEKEN